MKRKCQKMEMLKITNKWKKLGVKRIKLKMADDEDDRC